MNEDATRATERWFASRGVPQLIEGFSTEQRMDRRALPFIVAWIVVASVIVWIQRPVGPLENAVAMAVTAVGSLVVIGVVLWIRRHAPFAPTAKLDPLDIAVIGVAPGVVVAIIEGSLRSLWGVAGFVLIGVGVIYLVTGFGLLEVAGWALGYLRAQLSQIVTLVARTLPVLLILVVFLLFSSELWQAAHELGGADLAAVLVLLLAIATVLCVNRGREEIAEIEASRDPATVARLCAGTPAIKLGAYVARHVEPTRPLRWRERANLVFLMVVSQIVQSLFVGMLVTVFLVALGLLAIPGSVQEAWVASERPMRTVAEFGLFDEGRLLSAELLVTAGLLGGVCALYFTGLALTDAAYRAEFHQRVVGDVEQIMAVHAAYLAALRHAGEGRPTAADGRGSRTAEPLTADSDAS